ncbi:16S rRNA (cytidine(1402)-2'-O)-methyltransferase [Enterococcus cecorum]|uniref:16S rRNA (cytidine(1402)-2'-O)-methyltransferase n=1 Tax=Enterococcus cecorum TaxID=44008 RepID=UPI000DE90777|nr:16S rRNA (cytidine(1402)-2'-O)-methyltransferase [Enterococcus cecorum]RBR29957.1 16S rRNA (-2'-O)-methyltransferase [Enterococcus cecorum]RBR35704.1 16S rRNA (-2'-O)-methyltransferase [Enterococcus cecorum]RBR38042.1 16S rRNA (-2'-O)-methyltransferase [Enterococcus cecorum]
MLTKQKSYHQNSACLYLVPTPIGNLLDMTQRAVEILKQVDLIASEDTRNTQKLLNHFGISTPQKSLHEHNYKERVPQLVDFLLAGQSLAQVSDAGMPSISDPGHELVQACIAANIPVVALPGPTAGLTALIASGLSAQPNYFYGFLPRKKKEQVAALTPLAQLPASMIFYESPYRIASTLVNMVEVFGENRQAVICRELTKIHEEFIRGTLLELAEYAKDNEIKGECCLLVSGQSLEEQATEEVHLTEEQIRQKVIDRIEVYGEKPNTAIKEVAKELGYKKQAIYQIYHEIHS